MQMNYTDEEYHQLTIEEYFQEDVVPNLFGVSTIFTEARRNMTVSEYKAFVLALSHHDWTQPCPDTLYLDKDEVIKAVGIKTDIDHESYDLMRSIGDMPRNSFLKFADRDKDLYINGCFVATIASFRKHVRIRLNPDYLGLFGCLNGKERRYITMWSGDIFRMNTERAILFYEFLRDNSDSRLPMNVGTVSVKKFKELFKIPKTGKGSYTRNDEKHHFNRSEFEKYVIDPACEEIFKTEMIRLLLTPDGQYYEKVKQGNRVIAYKFCWTIQDPKHVIEEKVSVPEEIDGEAKVSEDEVLPVGRLWEEELKEFEFNRAQLDAIGTRLCLVPEYLLPELSPSINSIDIRRVHFMEQMAADLRVADSQKKVRNKYKYLLRMIENYGKDDD